MRRDDHGATHQLERLCLVPANSLWNTNISAAPVDPNSANIINFIGSSVTLHPDYELALTADRP